MHFQFTHYIDDEPKNMSPSRLEEASVEVKRVTLSVLGHNKILQGTAGSASLSDDEGPTLGFGPTFDEGRFDICQCVLCR